MIIYNIRKFYYKSRARTFLKIISFDWEKERKKWDRSAWSDDDVIVTLKLPFFPQTKNIL